MTRAALKRRRLLVIAWGLVRDQREALAGRLRSSTRLSGSAGKRSWDLAESVRYIDDVFELYLREAGLATEDLDGAEVLEIGPGDNLGVALRFAAEGARVTCVDRFRVWRDEEREAEIHDAVVSRLPPEKRERARDALGRIDAIHGLPLEEAPERLGSERFDLIVSAAVLEHLYDPDRAFDAMARLLKPGARMVHAIDMRDHGMFGDDGMTLEFLTVPEGIYRRMTRRSGGPNRHLLPYYRGQMERLGFESRILINDVVGEEHRVAPTERLVRGEDYGPGAVAAVERVRDRLAPQFRDLPEEELVAAQVVLSARRPG